MLCLERWDIEKSPGLFAVRQEDRKAAATVILIAAKNLWAATQASAHQRDSVAVQPPAHAKESSQTVRVQF
jgi:hypothetical protein